MDAAQYPSDKREMPQTTTVQYFFAASLLLLLVSCRSCCCANDVFPKSDMTNCFLKKPIDASMMKRTMQCLEQFSVQQNNQTTRVRKEPKRMKGVGDTLEKVQEEDDLAETSVGNMRKGRATLVVKIDFMSQ